MKLALLLALLAGCRSPGSAPLLPPLLIGVREDVPPLIFKQHGRWLGVEADLARALTARLEMRPVFVAYSSSELSAALLDGNVDLLMAALAISEERRVQMDFSFPYLVVGQAALVRTEEILRYNTEIKIRNARARVGVIADSEGDRLVSHHFSNATRTAFPGARAAAEALRLNQIDLFIYDAPSAWWLTLQYPQRLSVAPALFARQEIAWAFRRGSVSLRNAANQALADWQRDGTLEAILLRWIPFSK